MPDLHVLNSSKAYSLFLVMRTNYKKMKYDQRKRFPPKKYPPPKLSLPIFKAISVQAVIVDYRASLKLTSQKPDENKV